MRIAVQLPDLQSPAPRVSVWYARIGDLVLAGDRLIEILVDAATVDILAPETGRLAERHVKVDESIATGQLLAVIETNGETDASP